MITPTTSPPPASAASAGRTVAVGDIHGEIEGLDAVLRAAKLMDADGRWVGGDGCIVRVLAIIDPDQKYRFETGQ